MDVDLSGATWRKSTYSNGTGGNCLEVAGLPGGAHAIRDSKDPDGGVIILGRDGWASFIQGIKAGQLA
jgi:hypothetical protein